MKAKFKVNQLAAKPIEVELKHPVHGDTGIMVKIVGPQSKQFAEAAAEFEASAKGPDDNIRMFARCFVDWDADAFEMPFSHEDCFNFLKQPENGWVAETVAPLVKDHLHFFR